MANKKNPERTEVNVSVRLTKNEEARLEEAAAILGFRGVGAMMRSIALAAALEVKKRTS